MLGDVLAEHVVELRKEVQGTCLAPGLAVEEAGVLAVGSDTLYG